MDADLEAIDRLEAENTALLQQLLALKSDLSSSSAQDAIILRGVTGQISEAEAAIEELTAENARLVQINSDYDALFTCDTREDAKTMVAKVRSSFGASCMSVLQPFASSMRR